MERSTKFATPRSLIARFCSAFYPRSGLLGPHWRFRYPKTEVQHSG